MRPIWIRGALMTTPEQVIRAYHPNGIDPATWSRIAPLVRDTVTRAGLRDLEAVRHGLIACARFVAWADRSGYPLDREQIFAPDMVERYTAVGMAGTSNAVRSTRRSMLRRVARVATTTAPWEPKPLSLPSDNRTEPYTVAELDRWWTVAAQQATASRIQTASAVIALGAGAGLSAIEMVDTTADNVARIHGAVVIRVPGSHAREVPVRAFWAPRVLELARTYPTGPLMGPTGTTKNRMNAALNRVVRSPDLPKLNVDRLRTTWAVDVLNSGVRIAEFMRVSGWSTGRSLVDLLPHLTVREPAQSYPVLAGARD